MPIPRAPHGAPEPLYPDSDGQPIAENTLQFGWIVKLKGNLEVLFRDRPDVFVAGDLLWYAVEGEPTIRQAPDALVVFGRPKGYRGSYQQWKEGGIAPQVVFEVLSPGNGAGAMRDKRLFYERYGVEEYYVWDPEEITLEGWQRDGLVLRPIPTMSGWVSPRLGVRFVLLPDDLQLFDPKGRRFVTFGELDAERREAYRQAEEERRRAEQAGQRAEQEKQRAEQAEQQAQEVKQQMERLLAHFRSLGIEPPS